MSPVETLLAEVLADHYATKGWAPRRGDVAPHKGRWGCACDAGGVVEFGRRVVDYHRAHVAAEQAKALQAWLLSDETFEVARDAIVNRPVPPYVGFGAARADAKAVLANLADLIGGTP